MYYISYQINKGKRDAEIYNKLGIAYWKGNNDLSQAENAFREAKELDPSKKLKRKITRKISAGGGRRVLTARTVNRF